MCSRQDDVTVKMAVISAGGWQRRIDTHINTPSSVVPSRRVWLVALEGGPLRVATCGCSVLSTYGAGCFV